MSVKTVCDTYCHDQFKRMFVHPHRGLILLNHGGDYDVADNLKKKEKKKKTKPGKQSNIPPYVMNPTDWADFSKLVILHHTQISFL